MVAADDNLFLRPIYSSEWDVVAWGGEIPISGGSYWAECKRQTLEELKRRNLPAEFYDTHAPCVMSHQRVYEAAHWPWENIQFADGWAVWSVWFNVLPPERPLPREACTFVAAPGDMPRLEAPAAKFAGFTAHAHGWPQVRTWLEQHFPEPSRWERARP